MPSYSNLLWWKAASGVTSAPIGSSFFGISAVTQILFPPAPDEVKVLPLAQSVAVFLVFFFSSSIDIKISTIMPDAREGSTLFYGEWSAVHVGTSWSALSSSLGKMVDTAPVPFGFIYVVDVGGGLWVV